MQRQTALRVLIADDHPVVRMGVRSLLREHPGFGEPREAATKAETLALVEREALDVVVMNTTLVDADALEVLRSIKTLRPALPVILLHPEPDPAFARAALAGGASGIVTKAEHEAELLKAIEAAANSETYVGPAIAARMDGETLLN